MPATKVPMTNSYKAIFIFAIVMSFVTLLAGNKGGIGTLFWGYVAWMMYKRDILGLITLFKVLLGLLIICFFLGFLFISNGMFEERWFGYSGKGYFLAIFIAGCIDLALLEYFKNCLKNATNQINRSVADDRSEPPRSNVNMPSNIQNSLTIDAPSNVLGKTSEATQNNHKASIFSDYTSFVESLRNETVMVLCPKCANKFTSKQPLRIICPSCSFSGEGIRLNESQY